MDDECAVLAPPQYRVLSGSALKVLALLTMFCDHFSKRILSAYAAYTTPIVPDTMISVCWLCDTVGRLAFPIYCFLLVEGFVHTRSRARYARNLFVFALISEIAFDLSRSRTWVDLTYQNVFFTLLIGFLGIWAYEELKQKPVLRVACVLGLAVLSMGMASDYGPRGYATILILYVLRADALAKTALCSCIQLSTWRAGLAFIPINLYNGQRGFIRGPILKYFFYAAYPLHLFVLYQMRLSLGI